MLPCSPPATRYETERNGRPACRRGMQTTRGQANPTWLILDPISAVAASKANLNRLDDGSLLAAGAVGKPETYTLVAHTHQKGLTGIATGGLDRSLRCRKNRAWSRAWMERFLLTEADADRHAHSAIAQVKPAPRSKLRAGKALF